MTAAAGPGVLSLALAIVAGCASAQGSAQPGPAEEECTVSEVERFRLRDSTGDQFYVEPRLVLSSGGATFLLGKPSYRFTADTVQPGFGSRFDVFGAILRTGRVAELIPEPVESAKVKPIAAAPLEGGAIGVIFLEFHPDADTLEWVFSAKTAGAVQDIWYAEYRAGAWTARERLPMGESVAFDDLNVSALVASGDTLVWAIPATGRDASRYAAVFERVNGIWTKHVLEREPYLPIISAGAAHTHRDGFLLGLVRADPEPGYRISSLFAYRRDSSWHRVRGVIPGEQEMVMFLVMAGMAGDTVAVAWLTQTPNGMQRSRVLVGDIVDGPNDFLFATNNSVDTPVPLPGLPGAFWVAEETDSVRVIRVDRLRSDGVRTLWQTPNPYTGFLGATATPGEILVTGPHFESGRLLVTLLIRLRVRCE